MIFIFFQLILNIQSIRVLFLSDINLDLDKTDDIKYGEEISQDFLTVNLLSQLFLKQIKQKEDKIDSIIIGGNQVKNGLTQVNLQNPPENWEKQKAIINSIRASIDQVFGNDIQIHFTIGKNDQMYDDNAPPEKYQSQYYQELWDIMTKDKQYFTQENQQQFLKGGYYISQQQKLCYSSINSIYFTEKNQTLKEQAQDILDTLETKLQQNDCKFIIFMYHPFGLVTNNDQSESLFASEQQNKLLEILSKYDNKIQNILSAYTHYSDIRLIPNTSSLFISLPSVSPSKNSNPGYSILDDDFIHFNNYQLQQENKSFLDFKFSLKYDDISLLRNQMAQEKRLREMIMISTRGVGTTLEKAQDILQSKIYADQQFCAGQSLVTIEYNSCLQKLN